MGGCDAGTVGEGVLGGAATDDDEVGGSSSEGSVGHGSVA